MFSKLVFNIDGNEIELHLHEIAKITYDLLHNTMGEKIDIHSPEHLNIIFDDMAELGTFAHAAKEDTLDPLLFVPYHVSPKNSPLQWLFVAKYFRENYKKTLLKGWWLLIEKRLLLVKNEEDYRFYIGDHGFLSDIVKNVQEIVLDLPWVTNPKLALGILEVSKELTGTPAQVENHKKKFFEAVANESLEVLQEFHPNKTHEELLELKEQFKNDTEHRENIWQQSLQIFAYMIEKVFRKFCELKFRDQPNFDNIIFELYEDDLQIADRIIKRIVLAQLAKEINQGLSQPLFRPIFSYGIADLEDAYHGFSCSISEYFAKPNARSPQQLAKMARKILEGKDADIDDNTNFLPNLIAAWFIAEGARNPVSVLTSIIMLDMIENNITAIWEGENIYTWNYALKNPLNDVYKTNSNARTRDLYGIQVLPFEMGGGHPMAHRYSKRQGENEDWFRTAKDKSKSLNIVRQKEGNLLLHWTFVQLKAIQTPFSVTLIGVNQSPLELNPDLKTISTTLAHTEKNLKHLQGEIRVKKSKKTDVTKDLKKLENYIKLRKKQQLIEFLIKPLLLERMKTTGNLYVNIRDNSNIIDIVRNFYESFIRLNKVEYDFDEEEVSYDGNCMFKAVLDSANRVHKRTTPGNINTVNQLRHYISDELRSYRSKYVPQVSQSIRDILYSALENEDVFFGVSETLEIYLKPMLKILKYHTFLEKKFTDNIQSITQHLKQPLIEQNSIFLIGKLSKLREIQQRLDNCWLSYFRGKITDTIYEAYCNNIETDSAWGGQLELEMLASVLKIRVEIYSDTTKSNRNHFTIKRTTGNVLTIAHAYTVNDEASQTIHLLHTKEGHYNILNPTEYGLRHYYSSIPSPTFQPNILFIKKIEESRYVEQERLRKQEKHDKQWGIITYTNPY